MALQGCDGLELATRREHPLLCRVRDEGFCCGYLNDLKKLSCLFRSARTAGHGLHTPAEQESFQASKATTSASTVSRTCQAYLAGCCKALVATILELIPHKRVQPELDALKKLAM